MYTAAVSIRSLSLVVWLLDIKGADVNFAFCRVDGPLFI